MSGENEKLKKEKQILTSELEQTKKQCDDLMAFLCRCVKVSPEQIDRIISGGDAVVGEIATVGEETNGDVVDDDDDDDKDGDCFRLFGVLLKDGKKKRGRDEENETLGVKMKVQGDFNNHTPWMKSLYSATEQWNKVCN